MPDLNLNEEGAMEELTPSEQPSEPEGERPRHAAGGQAARLIIIFVALGVLAGSAYMLNELGIVKLWSTKAPVVAHVEEPALPAEQAPAEQQPAQQPAQEPVKAEPKKVEPRKEEPKPSIAQQPATQETKTAPPFAVEEKNQQEAKPQLAEAKKAEEQPRMLFRLKDPIVFPTKPRSQPALAMPATKEEPSAKSREESRPKEPAPTLKMSVPAQPKAEPKKETVAQATPPKQASPDKPQEEVTKPSAPKPETMKGTYTVQVYAFREKGNAEVVLKRLTESGYPAFIEPIEAKGMTWYTVRIGRYPSVSEAKKAVEGFAQEIKEHHFIDKVRTKAN
jgi:septal ring-binding cell division protein DamX